MINYFRPIILIMFVVLQGTWALHAMQQNQSDTARLLSVAIQFHNVEEVKRIITSGFDVNSQISAGNRSTPLDWAIHDYYHNRSYTLEIIKILIDAGARINGNSRNKDCLYMATTIGLDDELINYLISRGADVQKVVNFLREEINEQSGRNDMENIFRRSSLISYIDLLKKCFIRHKVKENRIKAKIISALQGTQEVQSLSHLKSADIILNVLKYLELDNLPEPMKNNIVEKLRQILAQENLEIKNAMISNLFSDDYWDNAGIWLLQMAPRPNIPPISNNTPQEKNSTTSLSLSLLSKFGIGSAIIAGMSVMAYKFIDYVHLRSIKAQQTILATLLEKAKAHDAQALQRAYQQACKKLTRITQHTHAKIRTYIKAHNYDSLITLLEAEQKRLSTLSKLKFFARIKA